MRSRLLAALLSLLAACSPLTHTAAPAPPTATPRSVELPSPTPPGTPTSPVSTPLSPTPSPSSLPATFSAGGFRWVRATFDELGTGPIAAAGDGLVMLSLRRDAPSSVVTLRQSLDGMTWRRLPDSPAFEAPPNWTEIVQGLAAGRSDLVAVGVELNADASAANAVAWVSPDGATWQRVVVGDGTGETMSFAYAVHGGYVALGTDGYLFHAGMARGTAMWTSTDGRRWLRLPQSEVPAGVAMTSIAHGNGRYVAVGVAVPPGGTPFGPTVPVWTSVDGVHYRMLRPASGAPPANAVLGGIVWTGSAFVTVGTEETVGAFAWRSTDGLTWQQSPLRAGRPGIATTVRAWSVGMTSRGLLAVGSIDDRGGTSQPTAWLSSDGREWRAIPLPSALDGFHLETVASIGSRLFVSSSAETTEKSVLWMLGPSTGVPSSLAFRP